MFVLGLLLCHLTNQPNKFSFTCDDCGNVFCSEHRSPAGHKCKPTKKNTKAAAAPIVAPKIVPSSSATGKRLGGAAVGRPRTSTTTPASKPTTPIKPAQSTSKASSNNNNAALEKLKSIWGIKPKSETSTSKPSSSSTSTSTSSTSSSSIFSGWKKSSSAAEARASRAQEVRAISQLKRDAKGDAKIELVNRRYLTVQTLEPPKQVPVYFRKDIITGKLLDKAAEVLNINLKTYQNSGSDKGRMAFYHERTKQYLPYNEKLSTTLGGIVKDGDKVSIYICIPATLLYISYTNFHFLDHNQVKVHDGCLNHLYRLFLHVKLKLKATHTKELVRLQASSQT